MAKSIYDVNQYDSIIKSSTGKLKKVAVKAKKQAKKNIKNDYIRGW